MKLVDRFLKRFGYIRTSEVPKPAAAPSPERKKDPNYEALLMALKGAGAGTEQLTPLNWDRPHQHRVPKPYPGVVPAAAAGKKHEGVLAMDAWSGDLNSFGAAGAEAWDGYGFMGYALLSELAQIPEFRRPSEILANEVTREWGKIVSVSNAKKVETLKALEAGFEKFKVREVFNRAFEMDNFFGIGHVFIDVGSSREELLSPLIHGPAKIAKGSLKAFRTVEPVWTYPNRYNASNPLDPNFYRPETWFVMGTEVSSSRLMTFNSRPVPDILKPAYMFGGLALTQMLRPYVENWLRTRQSVSDITHNFSTPVLEVDMDQMTTTDGARTLALRAEIYNTMRDNQGLMVVSKDKEGFKIESAPLAGLSELQAQAMEQMCFPPGIPIVKMFGSTPAGLNASTDGELRVFYDTCGSIQERIGTPHIQTVLEVMQLHLFGVVDPDIGFIWNPLWSASDEELAAIRKSNADVDSVYVELSVLDPMEVRKTLASEEGSRYASIDVDKMPEQPGMEEQGQFDLGSPAGQIGASSLERDPDEPRRPNEDEPRRPEGDDRRDGQPRRADLRGNRDRQLSSAERGARA